MNATESHTDIVFPKDNEESLVTEARRLGFQKIILCYKKLPKKIQEMPHTKIAVLLEDRRGISALRNKVDLLIGPPKREFFEDKRIDAILGPGLETRKDHTHYRRSLTQVEAELAHRTHKKIYFNFADVLQSKNPEELLGRWRQDQRVLKKSKAEYALVSGATDPIELRSRKDLEALWRALS